MLSLFALEVTTIDKEMTMKTVDQTRTKVVLGFYMVECPVDDADTAKWIYENADDEGMLDGADADSIVRGTTTISFIDAWRALDYEVRCSDWDCREARDFCRLCGSDWRE